MIKRIFYVTLIAAGVLTTGVGLAEEATSIKSVPAIKSLDREKTRSVKETKEKNKKGMTPKPNRTLDAETIIERVVFKRTPIQVLLRPGKERMVHFPHPVTLHAPQNINEQIPRLDIIDRTIYFTAQLPFTKIRVIAEDLSNGKLIPLDLVSTNDAVIVNDEIDIIVPEANRQASKYMKDDNDDASLDMVALTRYAAQMIYAPLRLIPQTPGVQQVKVSTRPVSWLYRNVDIEATPIAAWRSDTLYVTAVKLVNHSKASIELDMSQYLRGQWLAASTQHGRLLAAGQDEDTTVAYLISERSFDESR